MSEDQDGSFNASKAEIFEALSHPTRINVLRILSERTLPFSELKRAAGLESNGLLTFHLGKLRDLVKLNPEGAYALTDEGREALRIVEASRKSTRSAPGSGTNHPPAASKGHSGGAPHRSGRARFNSRLPAGTDQLAISSK